MDNTAMFKLSYGLYVLTAKDEKDNGCIINTTIQVTSTPNRISVTVNKNNYTHDMIANTKKFNVSILDESAEFGIFEHFGFQSGRDTDKMKDLVYGRSENNLPVLREYTNAFFSLKVQNTVTLPSHVVFLCTVEESEVINKDKSMTYAYYHASVKPKAKPAQSKGWVCKICGYVHPEEILPDDFICPLCKHPASDFEKIK